MTRVVIVGAGPAGIRAAETLAHAGLCPMVIDEGTRAGGQIYRPPPQASPALLPRFMAVRPPRRSRCMTVSTGLWPGAGSTIAPKAQSWRSATGCCMSLALKGFCPAPSTG
ncbi:NAD(P)-binding protein [Rhodovulum viride]|uniref:NAD(P)-binding protein n=1 Tax=Rhodovulum viride TaxID=1231134 RepID=UPI001C656782|nr:FAD-dependent oxidoreductase [Rhodovulum viride]